MPDLSEGPVNGKVTVGAEPVQLSAEPTNFPAGIYLSAYKGNTKDVGIGKAENVTVYSSDNDGFPLRPDTCIGLMVSDASKVWLVAESGEQVVYWLGN